MKSVLQHRVENIKGFLLGRANSNTFLPTFLQYTGRSCRGGGGGQFFQVAIRFHPSHLQPNIINSSFCALEGLLLTKLNHYFDDSIEANTFFGYSLSH